MISRQELERNMIHLSIGIAVALLLHFSVITPVHLVVASALSLVLYGMYRKNPIPGLRWFIQRVERPENIDSRPGIGAVYLLIGMSLASLLFEQSIAIASILVLAIGDSIAPLIGHLGRRRHPLSNDPEKLFEGSAIATILAFFAAWYFVPWQLALAGSVVGMFFEAIEIRLGHPVDDNITIPVTSGLAMTLLLFIL